MNTLRKKTNSTSLVTAILAGALLMTPDATQAQVKGSALPVAETLSMADRVMMVTDPSGTPSTKTATLTLLKATMAAGSGDVVGPATAVNNRVVVFDGTSGKLIKDSGLALSGTNTGDQDLSGYLTSVTAASTYQPLDSDLTAIAALTTTTTGRSLLAAADASAIRTIAGLGTAATATIATAVTNNAVPTIHNAAGSPDRAITGISATGKIVFSTPTGTGSPVWAISPSLQGNPSIGDSTSGLSSLRFYDSNGGGGVNYIGLRAPNDVASDITLVLPGADGTNGQALVTNGSGALSFATVGVSDGDKGSITVSSSGTVWTIDSGAVTDAMLAGSITPSKVTGTAVVGATGSTDNAILRADGTGGGTAQGSVGTITDAGAPTFYDSLTLLKTGSADGTTLEVANDPQNSSVRALFILPPDNGGRIYFGKSGRAPYTVDFANVTSVNNFPSLVGVAPYAILTYVGNISLQAVNGNVVLETVAGGQVSIPAGYVEMAEMTAPAAPASNKARYYFEDNGSGKTRFMVKFPTGAAQQIAIEP